jgi:hypothetical protein
MHPPADRHDSGDPTGDVEIAGDPELAALYREKLAGPVDEAKKERLRSAQRAGQIAEDADLDLALELLYAPLYQRRRTPG